MKGPGPSRAGEKERQDGLAASACCGAVEGIVPHVIILEQE